MMSDLIYGIHVIETILKRNPERVLEIFIQDSRTDQRIQSITSQALNNRISVQPIKNKELSRLLPDAIHQGVAARIRPLQPKNESDLSSLVERTKDPLFLILDNVQDPHNLGAALRTAEAAGATAVIIPKSQSAPITPVVRKIASGALDIIPLFEVSNLARTLDMLKKLNVWLVGTDVESTQTVYEIDLKGAIGIILGAEGTGLRKLTKDHCDFLVRIPMYGVVESLNVSVASGVCLYEARRQRQMLGQQKLR